MKAVTSPSATTNSTSTKKRRWCALFLVAVPVIAGLSLLKEPAEMYGIQAPASQKSMPDLNTASPGEVFQPVATAAIVALVPNGIFNVAQLCVALQTLQFLPDANKMTSADVVVFHDGLTPMKQNFLREECLSSRRKIIFPRLEYSFSNFFPDGFDPVTETPNWQRRTKWGYHQMIRFWITYIWKHSLWQQSRYKTIMRLDADACWHNSTPPSHLPSLPNSNTGDNMVVYHANRVAGEVSFVAKGFLQFVQDYVAKHNISVQNPRLYERIIESCPGKCPTFYNNFEVSRISFMNRSDVKAFHWAMTEEEPFGVFRYRWGDALARYAVMSLFAQPQQVFGGGTSVPKGYSHPLGNRSHW
eukprot:CAMPEP_0168830096 /NCGR_PEP_ID=MMETSP0727-20121128/1354_1 /TAXON_ID=265536 /ORGANISM="Amphiprora sp., Strain CCMP467" /LENGTH=357 /DNA_ID=CAMNT_0008883315 /DNA_START=185 /DNA_END=1255 /DNA_ORIENTATION=-